MLASIHNLASKSSVAHGRQISLADLGRAAGLSSLADRYLAHAQLREDKDGPVIVVPTSFHAQGIRKVQDKIEELIGRGIVRVEIQKDETPRSQAVVLTAASHAAASPLRQMSLPLPPKKMEETCVETERQNRLPAPNLVMSPEFEMPVELLRRWSEGVNRGASCQALWIFGEAGSGKTSLIRQLHSWIDVNKRLIQVDVVSFFHEWRRALESKETTAFMKKYRSDVDVLLLERLDDLQGKAGTQTELLYVVNALMERGASIAVSSTQHPMHVKEFLGESLFSRLFSGYTIEMPKPDRILKEKLWQELVITHGLSEWPLDLLVQQKLFSMPVRTIGKLQSIYINAIGRFSLKRSLSMRDLHDIEDMLMDRSQALAISPVLAGKGAFDLVDAVCRICGVSRAAIQGKSRRSEISLARRFVCLALSRYFGMTNATVASIVDKDPSTVHHALKVIEVDVETNRHISQQWAHIISQLGLDASRSSSSSVPTLS